ncbi:MAG: GNAT family N-acetyltransferase [Desulfobulbaceae bacterium]|nr:GNAT family N-acetyltransferase [Desulfobulbaceae bacterium]
MHGAESMTIKSRAITEADLEFLMQLYASTRAGEKALVGWPDEAWDAFMRMQFNLQHSQYMQNYPQPSFEVIMLADTPIGRLYVNWGAEEIRIIDIALLPEYQRRGIGGYLLHNILREGDERGLPVTLHVERNNPIFGLYHHLGFQEESAGEVYRLMKRSPVSLQPNSANEKGRL